jgi:hypothetical protein
VIALREKREVVDRLLCKTAEKRKLPPAQITPIDKRKEEMNQLAIQRAFIYASNKPARTPRFFVSGPAPNGLDRNVPLLTVTPGQNPVGSP